MNAKLPRNPFTMRIPIFRSLLAAFFLLLLLIVFTRRDSTFSSGLLHKTFKPPVGVHDSHVRPRPPRPSTVSFGNGGHYDMDCKVDPKHLREIKEKYGLGDRIDYLKRYVHFNRTKGLERKRMTMLDQKLLPDDSQFKTVDVNAEASPDEDACFDTLDVPVPASGMPSTVNASDFIFGVSTTYSRFMDPKLTPIPEWIYWLTDSHGNSNGGKLLLMLLDASEEQLQEVASVLGDVGIDVDVYKSNSKLEMAVRYLTLVPTLYTHKEASGKKWVVTVDDDTFFPNMHGLIEKFKQYDHTREMYIGTLSEDLGAVERHGSQAFGGGGVFLSMPLAAKVTENYGKCTTDAKIHESNSGWGPQGDIILRKCIYENTNTRLTPLWDLWQMDILGDPSGFYEWGIKPLSLHHYRGSGWYQARPLEIAKLALICGEDCTFMRFQTQDDYIISGYSIAHYPLGIQFDMNQMEGTLHPAPNDVGFNFDFMMGPARPGLSKTGFKVAWELQTADVNPDGSVIQTYVRKKDDERWRTNKGYPMKELDGVIELIWIPA